MFNHLINRSNPDIETNDIEILSNSSDSHGDFYEIYEYLVSINYLNMLKYITSKNLIHFIFETKPEDSDPMSIFFLTIPFIVCDLSNLNEDNVCTVDNTTFHYAKPLGDIELNLNRFIFARGYITVFTVLTLKIYIEMKHQVYRMNLINRTSIITQYSLFNWINLLIDIQVIFNIIWHIMGLEILLNTSDHECINSKNYNYAIVCYILIIVLIINCLYRFCCWLCYNDYQYTNTNNY